MEKITLLLLVLLLLMIVSILLLGFVAPIMGSWIAIISVYLQPFATPPASTIFIFGLSFSLNFLIQLLNRLIVDPERRKRNQLEIQKYQSLVQKARKTGSKKLQLRVNRRQKYIQKLQGNAAKNSMKPMLYYFIPFIIFFQILSGFYTPAGIPSIVAYFPFNFEIFIPYPMRPTFGVYVEGIGYGMYFIWWYMIVGFSMSTVIGRIFGTNPPETDFLEPQKK